MRGVPMRNRIVTIAIAAFSGLAFFAVPRAVAAPQVTIPPGTYHGCVDMNNNRALVRVFVDPAAGVHCPVGTFRIVFPHGAPSSVSGWLKVSCAVTSVDGNGGITAISGDTARCSFTAATLTVTCPPGSVVLNAMAGIAAQEDDGNSLGTGWQWNYDSPSSVTFKNEGEFFATQSGTLLCAEGSI
jgi:hypothetical protein